jgi:hypothetical protein
LIGDLDTPIYPESPALRKRPAVFKKGTDFFFLLVSRKIGFLYWLSILNAIFVQNCANLGENNSQ